MIWQKIKNKIINFSEKKILNLQNHPIFEKMQRALCLSIYCIYVVYIIGLCSEPSKIDGDLLVTKRHTYGN